jgi:hypothetical protein
VWFSYKPITVEAAAHAENRSRNVLGDLSVLGGDVCADDYPIARAASRA